MKQHMIADTAKIGIVGLDTSHAETFADSLSACDDANVAAVWDDGMVRETGYVAEFCEAYGASSYDDPVAMVSDIDAALVLTVDWDTHRELAVPFLDADVPTFIDKVVAGNVADIEALRNAAGDTPVFGGSSIPYHPELDSFTRGLPERTLYAAGYNDPFYYGVHIVDSVRSVAAAPWARVEPVDGPGVRAKVAFENDSHAVLQFDGGQEDPAFGFLDVADCTGTARIGMGTGYEEMREAFFDAFMANIRRERNDTERVLDAASLQVAVHAALDADEAVEPGDGALRSFSADGTAYASIYANDKPAAISGGWVDD